MTTFATIDIANTAVQFFPHANAAENNADKHDLLMVTSPEDLQDLTGPQSVALYNATAAELDSNIAPVKRFATKDAAAKRLWANLEDLRELYLKRHQAVMQTAKPAPKPKKASTSRRGTGVNLAPKAVVYPCRAGTKQAILVNLLSRERGATMSELLDALSGGKQPWLEVTVKSGLNWDMNKIKGYGIRTDAITMDAAFKDCRFEDLGTLGAAMDALKLPDQHPDSLDIREHRDALVEAGWDTSETVDVYRLTYPEGMDAPLPHTIKKG